MSGLATGYLRLLAVTAVVGIVQAVVEVLAIAVLYRDLLFAPYRFFTIQIYDAFTKLYFVLERWLPLPPVLDRFVEQGAAAKLALFPELVAINLFVSVFLTAALVVPARLVGLRSDLPLRPFALRAVALVFVVQMAVHVAGWCTSVKIPLEPTVRNLLSNLSRDAVFDGVLIAATVTLVASLVAYVLASRRGGQAAAAMATVFAAWAATVAAPADGSSSAAAAAAAAGAAPARDFNVVLISIDSLRADHMSAYGYGRETTPAIKRMAEEGVIFWNCSSTTSWTLPAHMSMLTGRSLLGHGVVSDDRKLGSDVPTLAESFRAAGYATGAVVSAPYVESRFGFDRGFDHYDDETISFASTDDSYKTVTAPRLNETATAWMDANRDRRFFLFLHYWDVHYDFAPGQPYDRMFDPDYDGDVSGDNFYFSSAIHPSMDRRDLEHVMALYDGEIRLVDDHIGALRDHLRTLGIDDRTLIVVTSDHGDEFFEHGRKGHHRSLYEEVLRVPFVLYVPGASFAGRRIDRESSIVDIMPTVLGLTGVAVPAGVEGHDFAPVLAAGAPAPERTVFAELYRKGSLNVQIAGMSDRRKAIHHFNVRRMETYDIAADPAEAVRLDNTTGLGAEIVESMRVWLDRRWGEFDRRLRRRGIEAPEMDAQTTEALRSLGYLQ